MVVLVWCLEGDLAERKGNTPVLAYAAEKELLDGDGHFLMVMN